VVRTSLKTYHDTIKLLYSAIKTHDILVILEIYVHSVRRYFRAIKLTSVEFSEPLKDKRYLFERWFQVTLLQPSF